VLGWKCSLISDFLYTISEPLPVLTKKLRLKWKGKRWIRPMEKVLKKGFFPHPADAQIEGSDFD
jgi:hypothetical protein